MIDKKTFKLSILIPCFNEKLTIILIIDEVRKSLKKNNFLNYEIIVIDDFSSDGTTQILKNIESDKDITIFYHSQNQGKGSAIQTALKNITGDITIVQDADLEYDPSDYNKLLLFHNLKNYFFLNFFLLHL